MKQNMEKLNFIGKIVRLDTRIFGTKVYKKIAEDELHQLFLYTDIQGSFLTV